MGAPDLLNVLRGTGLHLSAQGSELHVSPRAAITEDTRQLIREHKPEILKALTDSEEEVSPSPLPVILPTPPRLALQPTKGLGLGVPRRGPGGLEVRKAGEGI